VKQFKLSQITIEEMANKVMDYPPSRADQLFELIGVQISKLKKSTVLKATDICDKLFEELREDNLLIASGRGEKN